LNIFYFFEIVSMLSKDAGGHDECTYTHLLKCC
jgi:hypothetical protein